MCLETIPNLVLKKCVDTNIVLNLVTLSFDQFSLDNHRTLLIKSIVSRYVNIRFYYISKNKTQSLSIRHYSNKIEFSKDQ